MATIGEQLKAARLSRDLTIEDVAEVTKIRPFFLQCLEEGRYDKLPDQFCAVSFQRQYATALGLDEVMAVSAIRGAVSSARSRPVPDEPVAPALSPGYFLGSALSAFVHTVRKHRGAGTTVCVALSLIVAGSIWWYNLNRAGNEGERVALNEATTPVANSLEADAGGTDAGQSVSGVLSQDRRAAPGRNPALMEIEIRATDRLWVRYLVDGDIRREMTLTAGERRLIRAEEVVQVSVGNAAEVVLVVDGELHDKIGESGQVRHVRITREGLSFVPSGSF